MAADLPTSASLTDAATTRAQQKLNLAALRNFMANLLGTDSSDKPAARTALGVAPRATRIDVASVAGTVDLTTNAPNTDDIRITGALAITAFAVAVGRVLRVTAGGAFTLANNANISTQTGTTLLLAAGDTFSLRATAADTVEVLNLSRGVGGSSEPYVYIRCEKASGVAAGNTTAATWVEREFTHVVEDTTGLVTLVGNKIRGLPAGRWRFRARAPVGGAGVNGHQLRLLNDTDTAVLAYGKSGFFGTYSGTIEMSTGDAEIRGVFNIAAGKDLALEHIAQLTTASGEGFGYPSNSGAIEIYAEIEFWKEFV